MVQKANTMQGVWKNRLGGWNHKNQNRKKQTRKHMLKDKGEFLNIHSEELDSVKIYGEMKIELNTSKKSSPHTKLVDVQYVEFERYALFGGSHKKHILAYFSDGWIDYYTDRPILFRWSKISPQKILFKKELVIDKDDKPISPIKDIPFILYSGGESIHIFGKPVEKWKINTFYRHTRIRSKIKKIANSKDRIRVRNWISNKCWDSEIKTHSLGKSILWEVW